MKPSHFKGRKNARRVNALAVNQKQLADHLGLLESSKKQLLNERDKEIRQGHEDLQQLLDGKVQRLKKCIANLEAKVMPQSVAESLRSKKNRSGFQRQRS